MPGEFPFRGEPRRWFAIPFIAGICLMILSVLIYRFPMLLVFIVAAPMFLIGLFLTLLGLDLWHGGYPWRERFGWGKERGRPPEDLE